MILNIIAVICGWFFVYLVIWLKRKADNVPARWRKQLIVLEGILFLVILIILLMKLSPWLLEVLSR